MSRAPEVFLPPWTLDCTTFFFCCSLTLGVEVVALANRRKSIAWRLLLFRPFFQKPVQYAQPLTVRPHLYMNAAASLYNNPKPTPAWLSGAMRRSRAITKKTY